MRDGKPLVYDGYCGLGGWAEGFLEEGWHVVGFDIERHDYGTGGYPGELILRDMKTIHGSELADADCFVFSPPCQRYSYMAMPWSRAKAQAAMIEADTTGEELRKLNLLFDTCFRLQREASEAAGHHIPMIVENVRGAQKWVGRAAYHYGSFYLWGDVPALMPIVSKAIKVPAFRFDGSGKTSQTASVDHIKTPGRSLSKGSANKFGTHNIGAGDKMMDELGVKADGSGWTEKGSLVSHNRLVSNQGLKVPVISLSAGQSVGFNVTAAQRYRDSEGVKFSRTGDAWFDGKPRDKMLGDKGPAAYGSSSNSRKAASAMIAKIPYPLSRYIAHHFHPERYIR